MPNIIYRLGLVLFALLTGITGTVAQWKQIGPEVANVRRLAEVNGFIYAVDGTGSLYRSDTTLAYWKSLGRPSIKDTVVCVEGDGRNGILVGTTNGIFRLNALGQWNTKPLLSGGRIMWIHHITHGRILATGYSTRLIESSDYGETWRSIETTDLWGVKDLAIGTKGVLWALSTTLHRSEDGGTTWTLWRPFLEAQQWRADKIYVRGDTILVVGAEALQSFDGGSTWSNVSEGLPRPGEIYAVTADQERVYVACDIGIWGKRWDEPEFSATMNGFDKIITVGTILKTTDGTVLIGTNGLGVYALSKRQAADGSDSLDWSPHNGGMRNSWMLRPLVLPSGTVVVSTNSNEIFCNVRGETQWSRISRGTPFERMVGTSISRGGRAVFLQQSDNSTAVRYTDDDGYTWTTLETGDLPARGGGVAEPRIKAVSVHEHDSRRIAIGFDESIGIKVTGEAGWVVVDSAPPLITVLHYNDDRILAGTQQYGLYKWTRSKGWQVSPEIGRQTVHQIATLSNGTHLVTTSIGLWRSIDGGETWGYVPVSTNASEKIIDIAVLDSQRMAAISNESVYVTVDGGEHWTDCTEGLPPSKISGIGVDARGIMYITTFGEGLWLRSFDQVTSVAGADSLTYSGLRIHTAAFQQSEHALAIRYEVNAPMDIRWTMTTVGGEQVVMMDNRGANGKNELVMPIGTIASGIYILSATTPAGVNSVIVPIAR